jgi:hypothetical protein
VKHSLALVPFMPSGADALTGLGNWVPESQRRYRRCGVLGRDLSGLPTYQALGSE